MSDKSLYLSCSGRTSVFQRSGNRNCLHDKSIVLNVCVGSVADVSELHPAFVFTVEVSCVDEFVY
jgi:hypothetical protein